MRITDEMQSQAIAAELSKRFMQCRIEYPMTRTELAEKSMVSVGTIARFENGKDIGLLNVIKIMRALDIDENLDLLVPDPTERPSYHIGERKLKQRARKVKKPAKGWKWGDEK